MTTAAAQSGLFPDIDGLDGRINHALNSILEERVIVVCVIKLPLGETFRLPAEEYGIYILSSNKQRERMAHGIRVRQGVGNRGALVALEAIKETFKSFGIDEPRLITLPPFNVMSSWTKP